MKIDSHNLMNLKITITLYIQVQERECQTRYNFHLPERVISHQTATSGLTKI
jgi:hypothetical protein